MRKLLASASWKVTCKITETLNGEFIKTTLLRNADNQVTGIHRSKILMKQQRTRRWNIPLHRQRREVKAQKTESVGRWNVLARGCEQNEATERYRHQMQSFFRMSVTVHSSRKFCFAFVMLKYEGCDGKTYKLQVDNVMKPSDKFFLTDKCTRCCKSC